MKLKHLVLSSFFLFPFFSQAQNAILPFTGAKIFSTGISAKSIEISADGYILTSEVVPLNKEVEIKLIAPLGFVTDASKRSFPAAEVIITNTAGIVLGRTADAFAAISASGFAPEKFKELVIKTILESAILKNNTAVNITINISDKKSKNGVKIIFPVTVSNASLKASAAVTAIPVTKGGIAYASNLKVKNGVYAIDNDIRVDPTLSYCSLELTDITGATIDEVLAGTESYMVYNATTLLPIIKKDKLLKRVKGGVEGNVSSYLLKIPFKLKTDKANYFVRFRWVSKDGVRVIDGVFQM